MNLMPPNVPAGTYKRWGAGLGLDQKTSPTFYGYIDG